VVRTAVTGISPPLRGGRGSSRLPVWVVAAAIVLTAAVRLRLADVPLERDEGEYAYAGQLLLHGTPPYVLAYNMKFPGVYYANAAILAAFGSTPRAVRLGLLLVNAASIVLVFALGRRLLGPAAAAAAAATFALLSLDRWVLGVFAHATHFVILFALAGLLVLLRGMESGRRAGFLAAGVLLGISVLMKQQGGAFVVLAAGLLLALPAAPGPRGGSGRVPRLLALAAGVLVPGVLLLGVLAVQGVLGRFWFWTVTYASAYAAEVPWSEAGTWFTLGWGTATRVTRPFWGIAAAGFAALWMVPHDRRTRVFVTGLVVASGAAVCPGLYFREHYFILLLPAVALLCGVAWKVATDLAGHAVSRQAAAGIATLALALPAGFYFASEWEPLVSMTPREFSRARFGPNPFIEAEEIAAYLRDHTDPGDRIAVVGSEPEIYFLADRASATGYIYTYGLVEPQPYARRMQEEMRAEIEAAAPAYLVYVQVALSWLPAPGADPGIFEWVQHHTAACYDLVGIAEVRSQEETVYAWDEAVAGYEIRAPNVVFTYRRNRGGACPDPGSPDAAPIAALVTR